MKPVAPDTEHLEIGHVDTMYSCGDDVKIQFDSQVPCRSCQETDMSGKSEQISVRAHASILQCREMSRAFFSVL